MPSTKLTKANVKRLDCHNGKRKVAYTDTHTPGLLLEIRASGGRTFYFRYHDERGRQKNIKIGDAAVVSLEAARKQVEQLASERAQGRDPAAERDERRQTPTFAQFAEDAYLPYARDRKRSWKSDETYLRIHLLPAFGKQPMNAITKNDIIARLVPHQRRP